MLATRSKASLLVVDVQERLLPVMHDPQSIVGRISILLRVAHDLDIPITISEQYPKGLGRTVSAIETGGSTIFAKTAFSCWRDDALKQHFIALHESGRPQVIVAGIEAHVCVLQTCIDLANAGFGVFVVADATASRDPKSVALALQRMRDCGVQVVNTEMMVFELLEKAGTEHFKALSQLIK